MSVLTCCPFVSNPSSTARRGPRLAGGLSGAGPTPPAASRRAADAVLTTHHVLVPSPRKRIGSRALSACVCALHRVGGHAEPEVCHWARASGESIQLSTKSSAPSPAVSRRSDGAARSLTVLRHRLLGWRTLPGLRCLRLPTGPPAPDGEEYGHAAHLRHGFHRGLRRPGVGTGTRRRGGAVLPPAVHSRSASNPQRGARRGLRATGLRPPGRWAHVCSCIGTVRHRFIGRWCLSSAKPGPKGRQEDRWGTCSR